MTTFPNSPRLLKGGIVLIDPDSSAVPRVITLQYNPDTLSRTLQAVLEKTPELQKRLTRVTQPTKNRLKESKERRSVYEGAFTQLDSDLGSLVKLLS